jgi:hypothetical protein
MTATNWVRFANFVFPCATITRGVENSTLEAEDALIIPRHCRDVADQPPHDYAVRLDFVVQRLAQRGELFGRLGN